jgi:chloramphenicol 3-O-phosphotransferase
VIIWLNGTFGVGKSSTAERLAAMVPGSRVFDPETVGQLLRGALGDRPVGDFQDWPAWRAIVAAALIEISRMTGQHLIAPQAVLKRDYLDQIFGLLRAADQDVFHVVLDASDSVLRNRIAGSDEAQAWRLGHLDEYQDARSWLTDAADFVVDTAASTPPQIARRIFAALPELPGVPARPEAAQPEAAQPEAAQPEAAQPEAAQPEAAQPEAAQPETAQPETAKPAAARASAPPKPKLPAAADAAAKPVRDDQPKAGLPEKSRVGGAPADRR